MDCTLKIMLEWYSIGCLSACACYTFMILVLPLEWHASLSLICLAVALMSFAFTRYMTRTTTLDEVEVE